MNFTDIVKELPYGAIKEVAARTNLSTSTVSQVFKHNKKSSKLPEILKAAAEYLEEYKAKEREAMTALNKALSPESLRESKVQVDRKSEKLEEKATPAY